MKNVIKGIKLIISGLLSPFIIIVNGVKELMYVSSRLQHIEDNLMYDATPDELNKRITSIAKQVDQNRTRYNLVMVHESQLKQIESDIQELKNGAKYTRKVLDELTDKTDGLTETVHNHRYDVLELKNGAKVLVDCVEAGKEFESDISSIRKRLDVRENISERLERDINELQLSLESMKPKDLGKFNFIGYEPTQIELAQIDAELAGEKIARQEYDYTIEDRARNKQIQDRMRADEAEYNKLSEPDDDGIIW